MLRSRILYEDNNIIVCHKPAGIATQTARVGQKDMFSELTRYLASAGKSIGGEAPYVGVVHRLDQPVEGILVFAKDKACAAALGSQIADNRMEKIYYAVVCGKKFPSGGELVDYLVKDGRTNTSRLVQKGVKDAKAARLSYEVQAEREQYMPDRTKGKLALVKIRLETGRHHQIRVQMRGAGMSLLGDYKYADETAIRISEQLKIKEIALCACELSFWHPKTGEQMNFKIKPENKVFQIFSE